MKLNEFKSWLKGSNTEQFLERLSYTFMITAAVLFSVGFLIGSFVGGFIYIAAFGSFLLVAGISLFIISELIKRHELHG